MAELTISHLEYQGTGSVRLLLFRLPNYCPKVQRKKKISGKFELIAHTEAEKSPVRADTFQVTKNETFKIRGNKRIMTLLIIYLYLSAPQLPTRCSPSTSATHLTLTRYPSMALLPQPYLKVPPPFPSPPSTPQHPIKSRKRYSLPGLNSPRSVMSAPSPSPSPPIA